LATPVQGGSLPWLAPADGPAGGEAQQPASAAEPDRSNAGRAAETGDRFPAAVSRGAETPAARQDRSPPVPSRATEAARPASEPASASAPPGAGTPQTAADRQGPAAEPDPSGSITILQPGDGQVAMGRAGEAARRILIEAKVDTWVEVRRGGGAAVFSRLMRAGETFEVPPQSGYRLSTGNAAGIDVSIDGQRLAPLGKSGAVRRNVVLDADALLRTPGVAP
jgi:cytoskeleton protein RodZ